MPSLIRLAVAILVLGIASARAAPSNERVVLVDPDPELLRAVTTTLAPWKLEVVTDPDSRIDATTAAARADARSARFVVWREGGELVVFDRERGETARRDGPPGTLDAVAAASAALTVKTLMRLPDPDQRPATAQTEIRVQAGLATRIASGGSQTDVGSRLSGAVLLRPFGEFRAGLMGDIGSAESLELARFKGTTSDWSLVAVASWTFLHGHLEIEPVGGIGIQRTTFEGIDNSGMGTTTRRDEREALLLLRVGGWVRWRRGMWTFGGALGIDTVAGTPTYTKFNNGSVIYAVPSSLVSVGLIVAADLGR